MTRGDDRFDTSVAESSSSIADARDQVSIAIAVDWIMDVIEEFRNDGEVTAWIGAAGFSGATAPAIRSAFQRRTQALREWCDQHDKQIDIFIANDAVTILKAPPLRGSGIAAIVGTGSVVMGTHPACTEGVIKRGGSDWVVSDEGSGVWMTIQAIRLIMEDIQARGSRDYRSPLLDRLADYMSIHEHMLVEIPTSHRALAKAEAVARRMAESRPDLKRFFANFVYPNVFDLASMEVGRPHDPIAAEVLQRSVSVIVDEIRSVSEILAAYTHDEANLRESLPVVIGGSIAANPAYEQRLRALVASSCRYVNAVGTIGDGSLTAASLALEYANAPERERRQISRPIDPLHPVARLL